MFCSFRVRQTETSLLSLRWWEVRNYSVKMARFHFSLSLRLPFLQLQLQCSWPRRMNVNKNSCLPWSVSLLLPIILVTENGIPRTKTSIVHAVSSRSGHGSVPTGDRHWACWTYSIPRKRSVLELIHKPAKACVVRRYLECDKLISSIYVIMSIGRIKTILSEICVYWTPLYVGICLKHLLLVG